MVPASEIIDSSTLVFVNPAEPGIYRKGKPGKFYFEDHKGNRISKETDLDRIKKLVLPPAWTDVWISAKKKVICKLLVLMLLGGNNTGITKNGLKENLAINILGC